MIHKIPNHLQTKDKPFFGFTTKDFLILVSGIGGGAAVYNWLLFWLPDMLRFGPPILMALTALAFVFVKPGGQPLLRWLRVRYAYLRRPQLAIFGLYEAQAAEVRAADEHTALQLQIGECEAEFEELAQRDAAEYTNRLPLVATAWETSPKPNSTRKAKSKPNAGKRVAFPFHSKHKTNTTTTRPLGIGNEVYK